MPTPARVRAAQSRSKVDEVAARSRQDGPQPEVTPHPKETRPTTRAGRKAYAEARRTRAALAASEAISTDAGLDAVVDALLDPSKTAEDAVAAGLAAVAAPVPVVYDEAAVLAVEAEPTDEVASTDRVERVALAKAESALLRAWVEAGSTPPRPATPNLDALHAESQHGPGRKAVSRSTSPKAAAPRKRDSLPEIYRKALDAKRGGPRGEKGTKVSDEAIVDRLLVLRAENPTLTAVQSVEVLYWVDRLAVSRGRVLKIWEAMDARGLA